MPPEYVLFVMNRLTDAGYEAYMVGGCVRDTLLRRVPNDYDISTNAKPEAVEAIFSRTIPTGIRHGTVTVLYGGGKCEVTTYRTEGSYSDHRRPDSVSFTSSLEEDLARRDFTVNAMAMDAAGNIIDPFGGQDDLKKHILRCVGEPRERFSEDALRMLRAIRFTAQLGFRRERDVTRAIAECAGFAANLSAERVASEMELILASRRPEYIWSAIDFGLLDAFLKRPQDVEGRKLLQALPLASRWTYFCYDLERYGCVASTGEFLRSMKLSRHMIETTSAAVEVMKSGSNDWKRLLRDYGQEAVLAAHPRSRALRSVIASGECCTLDTLAVKGGDIADMGLTGDAVGNALRRALDYVIDHPEDNERGKLMELIKEGKI